ncbi:MAG: penicillin acylase family protein [Candidatus Kapaibacterium sp.]|nr:MAG: penicillin acylase family protein [Candidatus Kapabacteria bacterium]
MAQATKQRLYTLLAAVLLGGIVYATSQPLGKLPVLSLFLDPWNGAYRTARNAHESSPVKELSIPGLRGEVRIYRDARNVPHIIAENDIDAVAALGYLTARDRLFQIDFQTRVAAGRLSEIFGAERIKADQFLRRTGMMLGAERTWENIQRENSDVKNVLEAFTSGANAYISTLSPNDYPFECRLLGYAPEAWSPLKCILVNQLMAYDLTFPMTDIVMEETRKKLGDSAFAALYPNHAVISVPQSPEERGVVRPASNPLSPQYQAQQQQSNVSKNSTSLAITQLLAMHRDVSTLFGEAAEGKGSNNWVVSGTKTRSQKPLLAGDPHLSLSLPAIWYEVQMITPTMNMYGATIPGAPLIIVGANEHLAWSPTNTGADVVDFYTVQFQNAQQENYWHNGAWKKVESRIQPIRVKGQADVQDTMRLTHWGPVMTVDAETPREQSLSVRWTAHEASTILSAIWGMNHAKNLAEFATAHKNWDVPAQNIVYADKQGNIALRSFGHYPVRKCGHGRGIHDGSTDAGAWIGRVPLDSVPGSINPAAAFLESANQDPVPSTYPYYLNYNWGDLWRGARIAEYLQSAQSLTPEDFEHFQTDVKVMQWAFIKESIQKLKCEEECTGAKKQAVERLLAWNGVADTTNQAALLFHTFTRLLRRAVWDEMMVENIDVQKNVAKGTSDTVRSKDLRGNPSDPMMWHLLKNEPNSEWLDNRTTPQRENADMVLKTALLQALDTLVADYGSNPEGWTWGRNHKLIIRHLTRAEPLKSLWRGPFPFVGAQATVLPAGSLLTTHSASWRMVVDFASGKPRVSAVYPGGPSGNPFSKWYDSQISTWLNGKLYATEQATSEEGCKQGNMRFSENLRPQK